MKRKRAKFRVGQYVSWRGQENVLFTAPIRRITEPQPGNYVLWLEIHEGRFKDDLFPINHQGVERTGKVNHGK